VVYLKSGEAICDVLAMTGAHQCALRMENERVYKSMRNDVNRKTNAEVANQGKTVDSAVRQVFAIRKVVDDVSRHCENVIVVNDGSTDNSASVCLHYKELYPGNRYGLSYRRR
jgi:hypothetical protein